MIEVLPITPAEIREIMAHFGWSESDLAKQLHVSRMSVWNWLQEKPINHWHLYNLGKLKERAVRQTDMFSSQ